MKASPKTPIASGLQPEEAKLNPLGEEPIHVISLGAGVQSSAMLLMAIQREITLPMPEHAIFADTQDEPAEVYRHLDKLEAECHKGGVTLHRVTKGKLSDAMFDNYRGKPGRFVQIPSFGRDGGLSMRACTVDFKIAPIRAKIQELRQGRHCFLWIGISLDEAHRMKPSQVGYITNVWPLVDRRKSRHDCELWLKRNEWSAPKSACRYCPYHSDNEWRRLRAIPDEWVEIVRIDRKLNAREQYLHRSLQPIDEVDFSTDEDRGQQVWFGNECEGMCGV